MPFPQPAANSAGWNRTTREGLENLVHFFMKVWHQHLWSQPQDSHSHGERKRLGRLLQVVPSMWCLTRSYSEGKTPPPCHSTLVAELFFLTCNSLLQFLAFIPVWPYLFPAGSHHLKTCILLDLALLLFCFQKSKLCLFSAFNGSYVFLTSFPLGGRKKLKKKKKAEHHETFNLGRSIKQRFLLFWNKHIKGQSSAF